MTRIALALASLLLLPATGSAQSVLLVLDVGSARVDADALRERISAEADRTVVRLGDAASRDAAETLTVAFAGEDRWVLRHQRGATDTWLEREGMDAAIETAAALIREPEDFGTRAGADLVDPFEGRWDPLRVAIEGELVRPFIARGGMVYVGVEDPFARDGRAVHLMDPWTR